MEDEDPEADVIPQKRNAEDRAEAAGALQVEGRVLGICEDIDDLHGLALERGAPNEAAAVGRSRLDCEAPVLLRDVRAPHRCRSIERPVLPIDRAAFRVAEPRGLLDQRLEHTL